MTDRDVPDSALNLVWEGGRERDWSGVPLDERMEYVRRAFEDPASVGLPPCQDISHAKPVAQPLSHTHEGDAP